MPKINIAFQLSELTPKKYSQVTMDIEEIYICPCLKFVEDFHFFLFFRRDLFLFLCMCFYTTDV